MAQFVAETRKAIAAALLQGGGVYAALKVTDTGLDPTIELLAAVAVGILAGIVVYFTPNQPSAPVV